MRKIILKGGSQSPQTNKLLTLSPSTASEMQHLLSPIIDSIRKNKIYSYHQLQNKNKLLTSQKKQQIDTFQQHPQSALGFYKKETNQNFFSYRMPKVNQFQKEDAQLRFTAAKYSLTKSSKPKQIRGKSEGNYDHSQKLVQQNRRKLYLNKQLKKHLVHAIDFDQIEKMLYKKKQTLTRYEMFIIQRHTKQKQSQRSLYQKPKNKYLIEYSIKPEQNKTIYIQQNQWSPTKKKFWCKSESKKKSKNYEMKNSFIIGKAFSTVQI